MWIWSSWCGFSEFIVLVVISVAAYGLRCIRPFWYGFVEVVVGCLVLFLRFNPQYESTALLVDAEKFAAIGYPLSGLATLTVGVYIIVRGLANMREGVTSPAWAARWDHWFPERARRSSSS